MQWELVKMLTEREDFKMIILFFYKDKPYVTSAILAIQNE